MFPHMTIAYVDAKIQHVNVFVYEMGLQEQDLGKRAKIDYLRLTPAEWTRVGQFADLLSVRMTFLCTKIHLIICTFVSMRTLLNRRSRPMPVQHFILPFRHSRHSTRPGLLVQDGRSMRVLHQHWMLLRRKLMSIMRRQQILLPMSWPCVRSSCACI